MAEETPKEKPKSFWNKYEFLIIAIATLLLIYGFAVFNQKINFFLGNELIVHLEPQQKSFIMHYGDVGNAHFDVSIDNFAYCRAFCSYSFTDRSKNEVIDSGNFEVGKGKHFTKSYDLRVQRLGSGQDIYSFDARCHSIRSFLCLTKSPEKSRSSLVIVNYDLSETEKELKRTLKQNVTKLLELLSIVDVLNQQLNQKYFELAHRVNLNNLSKERININDAYDKTLISIENLRSLWAVENYIKLSQLFNESYSETLGNIKSSIPSLDEEINSIAALHNELLSRLTVLNKNLGELGGITSMLGDNALLDYFDASVGEFNRVAYSITNNTFDNYNDVMKEINGATNLQDSVIGKSKFNATGLFFNFEHLLNSERHLLCSLRQECTNFSVAKAVENTERFAENYPDASFLRQECNSLKGLDEEFSIIRNETLALIAYKNASFPKDSEFQALANSFREDNMRKINNSYHDSFEGIKMENKTIPDVISIAGLFLPKNKTEFAALDYNGSINISLYLLSRIMLPDEAMQLLGKCQKLYEGIKITKFNFGQVSANITYKIVSKIDINLSDNPPICCIFNECKPCCSAESCKNDPKTFPVIFLHGHSLAKGNSPEFSLDSFNKLQSKLQDDGYLNAGIVSLYSQNEPLQQGVWGLSGKPVTVKVSYYYDAFRKDDKYIVVPTKSENIDTYALRLDNLIAMVKERTGKPKVNIIAHSMGGLVARRYIQIFGEDYIDKLVMIGTPNKGISGAVGNYCGFVGESRECQDMQENSLFINKLNDPLKQ
ncbi:MAG: alpha/beta fold hydrolase, partial [Candidatus Aenigmarchaeota archaeon]|nr:alpha/beta fold hydrolase [Candidatus Aenigmarchaeota archaeon]